jgi:putative ABC transport system permease protein
VQARSTEETFVGPVIINETAGHKLGFKSAAAAIGQSLRHPTGPHTHRTDSSEIIGVVPDFPEGSVHNPVAPMVFYTNPALQQALSVRLTGRRIPETLDAIDALWQRIGEPRPIQRFFVEQSALTAERRTKVEQQSLLPPPVLGHDLLGDLRPS